MRKMDVCDMEKCGTFHTSDKTIDTLRGRLWPQTAKTGGRRQDKQKNEYMSHMSHMAETYCTPQVLGGVSTRSRNGVQSRKGCVISGQMTKASNK